MYNNTNKFTIAEEIKISKLIREFKTCNELIKFEDIFAEPDLLISESMFFRKSLDWLKKSDPVDFFIKGTKDTIKYFKSTFGDFSVFKDMVLYIQESTKKLDKYFKALDGEENPEEYKNLIEKVNEVELAVKKAYASILKNVQIIDLLEENNINEQILIPMAQAAVYISISNITQNPHLSDDEEPYNKFNDNALAAIERLEKLYTTTIMKELLELKRYETSKFKDEAKQVFRLTYKIIEKVIPEPSSANPLEESLFAILLLTKISGFESVSKNPKVKKDDSDESKSEDKNETEKGAEKEKESSGKGQEKEQFKNPIDKPLYELPVDQKIYVPLQLITKKIQSKGKVRWKGDDYTIQKVGKDFKFILVDGDPDEDYVLFSKSKMIDTKDGTKMELKLRESGFLGGM